MATAIPAQRFLLVEVPGPWPRSPLQRSRIHPAVAGRLSTAAEAAGARLLLIRRPGRHPAVPHPDGLQWALADVRPNVEAVRWGRYLDDEHLSSIDVTVTVDPSSAPRTGPQQVALVCTHGTRDVCCAVRGRPVLDAIRSSPGWDVWETTHLGGDRFAANVLVLPTGDMFGRLDPDVAPTVLADSAAGRLDPRHHRGRCGVPVLEQATAHLVGQDLAIEQRGGVIVGPSRQVAATDNAPDSEDHQGNGHGPDQRWEVAAVAGGVAYVATISSRWAPPARLSCSASRDSAARSFTMEHLRAVRTK